MSCVGDSFGRTCGSSIPLTDAAADMVLVSLVVTVVVGPLLPVLEATE